MTAVSPKLFNSMDFRSIISCRFFSFSRLHPNHFLLEYIGITETYPPICYACKDGLLTAEQIFELYLYILLKFVAHDYLSISLTKRSQKHSYKLSFANNSPN